MKKLIPLLTLLCCLSAFGAQTNSGPITLSISGTNVAVSAVTPVGCVTNAPLPFRLTVTTNILVQNPTGGLDGQRIFVEFLATSNYVAYFDTKFSFGSDVTGITLSTTSNLVDFATFVYNSTADRWRAIGFTRGYQ